MIWTLSLLTELTARCLPSLLAVTVQAPHPPSPQLTLVPVSSASSLMNWARLIREYRPLAPL